MFHYPDEGTCAKRGGTSPKQTAFIHSNIVRDGSEPGTVLCVGYQSEQDKVPVGSYILDMEETITKYITIGLGMGLNS